MAAVSAPKLPQDLNTKTTHLSKQQTSVFRAATAATAAAVAAIENIITGDHSTIFLFQSHNMQSEQQAGSRRKNVAAHQREIVGKKKTSYSGAAQICSAWNTAPTFHLSFHFNYIFFSLHFFRTIWQAQKSKKCFCCVSHSSIITWQSCSTAHKELQDSKHKLATCSMQQYCVFFSNK